ncbi:MAG: DUF1538 domain-containing protein [Thermodesulfobacteriota bacterium]
MKHRPAKARIKVGFKDALGMLGPYVRSRVLEQVKSVWLIIVYLVLFQTIVLKIPVAQASLIAFGIGLVIAGLTFFMEGLVLGLMPLGERVGMRLPQRVGLMPIVLFAILLGLLATLAEPAIQVLQTAGKSVSAWEAPLLFMLLGSHAQALVLSVGAGVGLAVALGMIRFYYSWSLKPLIYVLVLPLLLITGWAFLDPNLRYLTGLAWDCGAVTTGPVTVPLVLALGVGISRMVGKSESGTTGFGVVTLASLFPILAVFCLGIALSGSVPRPMDEEAFFLKENRERVKVLFESDDHMAAYALLRAGSVGRHSFFAGAAAGGEDGFAAKLAGNESLRKAVLKGDESEFARWVREHGSPELRMTCFGEEGTGSEGASAGGGMDVGRLLAENLFSAVKAIGLLTVPLFLIMFVILREKMFRMDEVFLGLGFTVVGLCVFSLGIEMGLDRLGRQVGSMLPASFQSVEVSQKHKEICPFDPGVVQTALTPDGEEKSFFFAAEVGELQAVPYVEEDYDPASGCYLYRETRGPLFGGEGSLWGIMVVVLFAFIMGYGATLAEPALNALGRTVEELTVGTFRKSLLMQSVAVGVGVGLGVGMAKIIWDIPLAWLLIPSYVLLMGITLISTEEFVNVAWDSAGVTTGPITVPLVLAMGLGIGSQVGVVEGFGILAGASVFPILSVLTVGLYVKRVRKAVLKGDNDKHEEGPAIHG